jgi:uncharacterized protein with HEPN domain
MTAAELTSRLQDILEAIAAIAEYTAGKTFDDYAAARMLRDAVERNLERISEASRHLPKHLKARHSEIPWRKVADIGNILRHAYPIVDDSVVWEVVVRDRGTRACGRCATRSTRPRARSPSSRVGSRSSAGRRGWGSRPSSTPPGSALQERSTSGGATSRRSTVWRLEEET